eukprot:gene5244-6377_t
MALATSALWVAIYLVVLLDRYMGCQFESVDNSCFYGNYFVFGSFDTSSEEATSLWIWMREEEEEVLTVQATFPVRFVRHMSASYSRRCGTSAPGRSSTVPVQSTGFDCPKVALFAGSRFVLQDGLFSSIQVTAAETCAQLHAISSTDGISSKEVAFRQALAGPNVIPFEEDTWAKSLADEFTSFYYIYQLAVYSVWFWFSYMFPVATVLGSVVLVAGVLRCVVTRHAQSSIAAMSKYACPVNVSA